MPPLLAGVLPVGATIATDTISIDGVLYTEGDEVIELRDQYSKTVVGANGNLIMTTYLSSIHYEETPNNFQPIDTTIVPSGRSKWDWEVMTGHWQLFINNDTTIGVKKGNNWVGTRLYGIAYLDISTKDYTILQTTNTVTPIVSGNSIKWENILYGVDYILYYTNDSLKEDVVIKQEARDLLNSAGHRPSDYGYNASNTYIVPIFECDWSFSLPMKLRDGSSVNLADDDTDEAIYFEADIEDSYWKTKLVNFFPVYMATSVNPINPEDSEKEWEYAECVMKKRLVQKNDKHWLLTGVPVLELNQMPEGSIIFDPTETLRPDGAGDECNIVKETGADCPYHWQNVDEVVGDGDTTTVYGYNRYAWERDLYESADHSVGSNIINFIEVYAVCKGYGDPSYQQPCLKIAIKSGTGSGDPDTVDESDAMELGLDEIYIPYSQQWAVNPATTNAWTWDEIDRLQIGVNLTSFSSNGNVASRCTQVYVEIDYTEANPPDSPTNFNATDTLSDKVTCTWTKSVGATKYQVYRNGNPIGGELGDVDTWDDNTAGAPTITAGNAVATDGTHTDKISVSLAGTSTNDGTTYSYKVRAGNDNGWSGDSNLDNGHRAPGALNYQWQKSAGDADNNYNPIGGATGATYNDNNAPSPTITAGNAVATDGDHSDKVALSLAGTSSNDGAGRYYKCDLTSAGCANQTSGSNRGHTGHGVLSYQWEVDRGAGWGDIAGAVASTYNDVDAPAGTVTPGTASASDGTSGTHITLSLAGEGLNDGATQDYRCKLTAPDADNQTSGSNTGFRRPVNLTYQWYRSNADADAGYALLGGATTDPYNDATAPANGDGRWYYCEVDATGAVAQDSTHDRGFRGVIPTVTTQVADNLEATTALGHGTITDTGSDATCDERGFDWDTDSGAPYANSVTDVVGGYGVGAFEKSLTSLPTGTTIYYRAKALNTVGWGYGGELTFLTKPAPPANVSATSGDHSDKVVFTWDKSTGATDYQVYRDGVPLGWLGDVATYDDNGADAGTVTSGTASASDGTFEAHTVLSLAGESINDGTTHSYEVRAKNETGESSNSATDTGFRRPVNLTYQGYRSNADADGGYAVLGGATTDPYNDTTAPADGSGRWYYYEVNATGAVAQDSTHDRGYRECNDPPLPPTNFTLERDGLLFTFTWEKGLRAEKTHIRGKKNDYPTSITDGVLIYDGTGLSVEYQVTERGGWFFGAWSVDDEGQYSLVYSKVKEDNPPLPGTLVGNEILKVIVPFVAAIGIILFILKESRGGMTDMLMALGSGLVGGLVIWIIINLITGDILAVLDKINP